MLVCFSLIHADYSWKKKSINSINLIPTSFSHFFSVSRSTRFEFTESLLGFMLDHVYSCLYGNFLANSEKVNLQTFVSHICAHHQVYAMHSCARVCPRYVAADRKKMHSCALLFNKMIDSYLSYFHKPPPKRGKVGRIFLMRDTQMTPQCACASH